MSAGKIYSATYSGIQVYEMMIHGIATMVRGSDQYLNATQILKVAGFEKTRRSKILEREVLTGEHEKVQGGYGKYQGTWIPFEKGKELAEKYEVLDRMMPLLTFDPASIANNEEIPTKEQVKEQVQLEAQQQIDRLLSDSPPRSPLTGELDGHRFSSGPLLLHGGGHKRPQQFQHHKHSSNKKLKLAAVVGSPDSAMEEEFDQEEVDEGGEVGGFLEEEEAEIYKGGEAEEEEFDEHHRNLLMNIFLSDNPDDTPSALASTLLTNDVNIDLVIDEQGHTALHWAAALGRTKIVDLLISNGANVCSVNFEGETPLMRAAMITCCFENKCFAHMVEMMSDAITVFDKRGRTILHHIALTADVGGYEDAAIYYMKRLFKTAPKKIVLKNMMNIQDRVYGETALAIALRAGCLEIGDFLTKQGAVDPLTSNLEPDQTLEYVPVNYKQHSKGQDIINSLHNQVVEMEDQYQEQLRQRDIKSFQTKKEMNMLRYQLNEAQRRLELPVSMQLAEAQKRIHELEQLRVQSNSRTAAAICDDFVISNNTDSKSTTILEENNNLLDEDQPPPQPQAQTQSSKERKLEKKVKSLQNQLDAHSKTIDRLKSDLETTQQKAKQKEMEYRRLIAASCNLPIEKVDGLIGPLTLAIESDPPDLDMARVIGFMERLRRQNSTTSSSVNSPHNGSSSSGGGNNDTATTPV